MAQAEGIAVAATVAKYFFFLCFDERLSFSAGLGVLNDLKTRNRIDEEHRAHWVQALHDWKRKLPRLRPRSWSDSPEARGFALPDDFDLSAWVTYMNSADPDEVEAVLLSRILSFADGEIAEGLGVTVGTVRYRVGRGLRHLGGYVEP